MKILINTLSLRAGGGQKVGYNIVSYLLANKNRYLAFDFYFLCAKNSKLYDLLLAKKEKNIAVLNLSNKFDYLVNYFFKIPNLLKKINPVVIYSIFGYPLRPKKYCNIIGEAASNIFFPEINFWEDYKGFSLAKKKFIDSIRIRALKQADGIIFENEAMFRRSHTIFKIPEEKTCFIKPAIDKNINESTINKRPDSNFKLLLLCSWQLNKNIMIIPKLLEYVKQKEENIKVLFSVKSNETNNIAQQFYKEIQNRKVENYIEYIGSISPEKIPNVYEKIDAVLLLSKLESFSNNIIEAWKFQKPLIISDMEWSRSIIKNPAACFVNRDNINDIFKTILKLKKNKSYYDNIVLKGKEELDKYPNIDIFVQEIFNFIEKIIKNSKKEK